jgi:hypothetical protein
MAASNITRRGALRALAAGSVALTTPAAAGRDPVFAAIDAHRTAAANVRAAVAESNRLCELADRLAGKLMVEIPDLRQEAGDWPVTFERDGQRYANARCVGEIDECLPGDENESLRAEYARQLDDISAAREAVYGDIDAVVIGPADIEYDAIDNLAKTVPTTLPGLLAFLAEVAKADHELIDTETLLATLGEAATALAGAVRS